MFEGRDLELLCLEADIPTRATTAPTSCRQHAGHRRARRRRLDQLLREPLRPSGRADRLDDGGNVQDFNCVYHAWSYDFPGNLAASPSRTASTARAACRRISTATTFGPRKLRTTTLCGLVFATLSPDTPQIEEYIGSEVLARLKRVLNRPIR